MLSTNGSLASALPPASSSPDRARLSTARHASSPPRAATFFRTICAAVRVPAGAGPSANAEKAASEAKQHTKSANRFMISILFVWARRARSLDHQPVRMKLADHHIDAIPGLDQIALVGKRHPVLLPRLRCAALAQRTDFFHDRDTQQCAAFLSEHVRRKLPVNQGRGPRRFGDAEAEADQVAGGGTADLQLVDAPGGHVVV